MNVGRINRRTAPLVLAAILCCALPTVSAAAAEWIAPLPEPLTVTRGFDPPANPYGSGHRGVDLAGNPGQDVRSAGAGTVVYAGPLAGRGVISVQHADGLRTTYEPVSATVAAGMQVGLGHVIGTLESGHAGCPTAACLHWGLRRGETYLDPLLLLAQGPVRLLPRYGAGRSGDGLALAAGIAAAPLAAAGVVTLVPLALGRRRRAGMVRRGGGPADRPP